MTLLFVRVFFVIITSCVGFYIGSINDQHLWGMALGAGAGGLLILLELSLKRVSVRGLSSMVFGLLLGIVMAKLISDILSLLPLGEYVHSIARVIFTLVLSYLGAVMALRGKDEFNLIIPYVRFKRQDMEDRVILLDTSAIIDGRVLNIAKTSFMMGRLVVPRFVLQELQRLADSTDMTKKAKGQRGVELLGEMQKDPAVDVRIQEDDISGPQDVDMKMVRLAKLMDARICTTDYNLGHIATIQGVGVLNINELANAVHTRFFPGEEVDVQLVKEGREAHQAVAYTEDGTMIVVAEARPLIGQKVHVLINSVLQTQSGRVLFAKVIKAEG